MTLATDDSLAAALLDIAQSASQAAVSAHLTELTDAELRAGVETALAGEPALRPGPVIAEFSNAVDARMFARLKRESGSAVTVTAGINHLYAVRLCV